MNPDIDLRLKSVEKALTDVIARAVPKSEKLARDQLELVVGHLRVIGAHWKHALRYELGTLDALAALGGRLRDFADADARVTLDEALAAAGTVDRADFERVSAAQRKLAGALDRVIAANYTTAPMPTALRDAVLDHYAWAAARERVWHQGSGLDPDAATLPPLATLFGEGGP